MKFSHIILRRNYLLLLVTIICSACANSSVNTAPVSEQEKVNLSCQQIQENISSLRNYLNYAKDASSIAGMFNIDTSATNNTRYQAESRLNQLENLYIVRSCNTQ